MKKSTAVLVLLVMLSGCGTMNKALISMRNLSVGVYKATIAQIELADRRARTAYAQMTPEKKKAIKASGPRYLAVRTTDPNPSQMAEIRKEMKSSGSSGAYGSATPSNLNRKIYCVMIWDTQVNEIVGKNCYAVLSLPKNGSVVKFDTYTAEYVGSF